MDAVVSMPGDRRQLIFEEASASLGLSAGSIEKDFWACWLLRTLFRLPTSGALLTFKGGTSLSKGWKLIQRFSEDLDLVIDRVALGFGGPDRPEDAPSQKQRSKLLEAVAVACQHHVRDVLRPELSRYLLASPLVPGTWSLTEDADDRDGQTLLFSYPAVAARSAYLRPVVKLEFGARSDVEPTESPRITPYLADALPTVCADCTFSVRAVAPIRTFWEKVALLHEESYRTTTDVPKARLARHYYDLWALIQAGIGEQALSDLDLFARVAAHRAVFFRKRQQVQASLRPGLLRVVPSEDRRPAWAKDYEAMRESMFFEEPPSFDEILAVVAEFERQVNNADK